MSETVVDLSNLREAIGDDRELELELFDEFISSSQDLVVQLEKHCGGDGDNETWRQDAHALKGVCLNLGAEKLGQMCGEGQAMFEENVEAKQSLLDNIKLEHSKVLEYLKIEVG